MGMLMAMRLGFNTMDKTDTHLVRNRRVSNSRAIIENEIDGFIFTRPLTTVRSRMKSDRAVSRRSEPQSMRFVTSYSLRGRLARDARRLRRCR